MKCYKSILYFTILSGLTIALQSCDDTEEGDVLSDAVLASVNSKKPLPELILNLLKTDEYKQLLEFIEEHVEFIDDIRYAKTIIVDVGLDRKKEWELTIKDLGLKVNDNKINFCLLYTSPSPRDS